MATPKQQQNSAATTTKAHKRKKTIVRKYPEVQGMRFTELESVHDLKKLSTMKNPYVSLVNSGFWSIDMLFRYYSRGQHRWPQHYYEDAQDMKITWQDFTVFLDTVFLDRKSQVRVRFPVGADGKFQPGAKKFATIDFHETYGASRASTLHNTHYSSALEREAKEFFSAVIETWKFKHRAVVETMRTKLETDPEYLVEYNLRHDVEKTQSTMQVLKHLMQLRGALDAMISGVHKGYVSEGTYSTYCKLMDSLGKDKRPVTRPIQQHFLVKNKKK